MNLNDLVAASPAKHYKKILEGHFGHRINVDALDHNQAGRLLRKVRGLISECKQGRSSHYNERDASYLKLMVVEQALVQCIYENTTVTNPATGSATHLAAPTPAQQQQMKSQQMQAVQKIKDPKLQTAMKKSVSGQSLSKDEQQTVTGAMMGGAVAEGSGPKEKQRTPHRDINSPEYKSAADKQRQRMAKHDAAKPGKDLLSKINKRNISESEVQQAQVILASQDLVDQVQKMIEQCTSIQFKDLPALVNQVKNEIGYDQAVQFNSDASAALSALVQSMQGSKQQLEAAVGVVTGQQASIPTPQANDLGAAPPAGGADMDFDMDMDFEEPTTSPDQATFGRDRVSESRVTRKRR